MRWQDEDERSRSRRDAECELSNEPIEQPPRHTSPLLFGSASAQSFWRRYEYGANLSLAASATFLEPSACSSRYAVHVAGHVHSLIVRELLTVDGGMVGRYAFRVLSGILEAAKRDLVSARIR